MGEDPPSEGSVLLVGDFAVRETIICRGSYVLKLDDIDALETVSTASVWAVDTFNTQVMKSAETTTSLEQVRNNCMSAKHSYCESPAPDFYPGIRTCVFVEFWIVGIFFEALLRVPATTRAALIANNLIHAQRAMQGKYLVYNLVVHWRMCCQENSVVHPTSCALTVARIRFVSSRAHT